ncbi:maltose alpha-D-glucosyltransferase [Tianweitania sp.]|uniref:maltose alpha-D-glucosyltransferase n=1 Tax=Tianweitania sp. TaxID=2021634 RepID=UPI00289F1389|nr:maltose alpha-D-glucosyltransferase [Tianweitania sp.]
MTEQNMTEQTTTEQHNNDGLIDRTQTDWYRDAVIYQLHVKAFQDSNDDGMGDFAGLMRRLDHVQQLGATAIWLLPFYPSPLRDDGYDIADYTSINPSYGTMPDFKGFIDEAHRRGLRVITELVINHTSDQHPWFQEARNSPPGSPARDMYVWSDTDTKFPETRIIFTDTEKSNWTWDPVAGAFFWHRFYSHQPDLNFDNPRVLKEVVEVMNYWLDMGVDGLRLDAIPYLIEREGTNNENLPETHDVLKAIRAELDKNYSDRMLLAEANQWPEDTRPYFGEGDECHMGFHFPLMPRMYMAVAQEDRHPLTDIIRQTPDIPEGCQWGIFLRNHDELTLEMVTDQERDYLWRTYAEDSRARINLGIRRRLAPLMQNDRRKIELMNSLLLSMPGTPILYYGDEIGMGDNYYLGDRDGVRTPMQWSQDRNGGFSRANPQQLYLPAILDPNYGYQTINVESQDRDPSSLLNWMRRIVAVRKEHPEFGRGEMTLLYPGNRKILAYVREHEGRSTLCVANLSRAAQAVELDLARWKGAVPIELLGRSAFPPVGDLPYLITLPAYGFYWFVLADEAQAPSWHQALPEILPEFITLTTRDGRVDTALKTRDKRTFDADILPQFLKLQRWFGAKDRKLRSADVRVLGELGNGQHALSIVDVELDGGTQQYFLPMSSRWGEENITHGAPKLSYTIAKLRRTNRVGALIDGSVDEDLAARLLQGMRDNQVIDGADNGKVVFTGSSGLAAIETEGEIKPLGVEQSNVSIAFGDAVVLKLYRRLRSGVQPDVEVARFLTDVAHFENTPAYLGSIEHQTADGEPTMLASAFAYVRNQGDAWKVVTDALKRGIEDELRGTEPASDDAASHTLAYAFPLSVGEVLGQRTAELHCALATQTDDPAFAVEPITADDLKGWISEASDEANTVLDRLAGAAGGLTGETATAARALLDQRDALLKRIAKAADMKPSGARSRIHGDYHLGQLLVAQNDVMIIDFEGEPRRSVDERRGKFSPLRDVAGMLRSLDYAASTVTQDGLPETQDAVVSHAKRWRDAVSAEFLAAYFGGVQGCPTAIEDEDFAQALLDLFVIQKAVYEVGYELANRPAWLGVPLHGLLELLDTETAA